MNAYQFGLYTYENYGLQGINNVLRYSAAYRPVVETAKIAAGAASYYNPYIAAITTVPVAYEGAKWLVDKIF
jgi:hypothetical protein